MADKDNLFDTADDMNPFAQVDAYNPFQKTVSPRPTSPTNVNQSNYGNMRNNSNSNSQFDEMAKNQKFYDAAHSSASDDNDDLKLVMGESGLDDSSSSGTDTKHLVEQMTVTSSNGARVTVKISGQDDERDLSFWQFEFYTQYFDVESTEVMWRCLYSLWPFKCNFISNVQNNPDFYGPFWIATTLIFMMAASANLADYLNSDTGWSYNFFKLTYGSAVIYCYTFGVPVLLWLCLKWLDMKITLMQLVCVYGYSLFVYSPVSLLCIIPNKYVQWTFVLFGCFISTTFLIANVWVPLRDKLAYALVFLGVMAALHIGLAMTFQLYFFQFGTPLNTTAVTL